MRSDLICWLWCLLPMSSDIACRVTLLFSKSCLAELCCCVELVLFADGTTVTNLSPGVVNYRLKSFKTIEWGVQELGQAILLLLIIFLKFHSQVSEIWSLPQLDCLQHLSNRALRYYRIGIESPILFEKSIVSVSYQYRNSTTRKYQ